MIYCKVSKPLEAVLIWYDPFGDFCRGTGQDFPMGDRAFWYDRDYYAETL